MEDQQTGISQRINLRVGNDTFEVIKRLAAHKGTTSAGFVRDWLEEMHPHLVQMLGTLDASDHVKTVEHGVSVLDQLRGVAVNARLAADRLDAMVDGWQADLRRDGERGSDAGGS